MIRRVSEYGLILSIIVISHSGANAQVDKTAKELPGVVLSGTEIRSVYPPGGILVTESVQFS
jgi:hypothetical protein